MHVIEREGGREGERERWGRGSTRGKKALPCGASLPCDAHGK
jgi:hypothetical protein